MKILPTNQATLTAFNRNTGRSCPVAVILFQTLYSKQTLYKCLLKGSFYRIIIEVFHRMLQSWNMVRHLTLGRILIV